jgi:Flp pilus assembly protein TadD
MGWSLLGWTCLNLDRDDQAFDCFAKAVELSPNWDSAHVGLGVLCAGQGDFGQARSHYFKVIQINPDNAVAFSNLAFVELLEGNAQAAVDYGERAWAIRQDLPATAETLAIAYHYLGDVEKRDLYYAHAARLGHPDLEGIRDVFEGRASIR